ncbi:esterase/lipase family protein [Roseateles sp. P5_E1]
MRTIQRLVFDSTVRGLVLAVVACLGCAIPALAQAAAPAPCLPIEGPAFLGGKDPSRTSVVVFVHGVLSSARTAWSGKEDQSWPCLLRAEPAFDNSNIYLYRYDTQLLGSSPEVDKVAEQLRKDLQNDGVLDHAHITIVAHSMGGLVTAQMLLRMHAKEDMRDKLRRIKLVSFFGTPATGADIANVASYVSDSLQFAGMRPDGHQQALIDQWQKVAWPFHWYCLAEGQKMGFFSFASALGGGVLVVPKDSATALCQRRPDGVDVLEQFDHSSMVKPVSLQDTPHRYLKRYFLSCAGDAIPKTYPSSEVNTPDGQAMLQTLARLRASEFNLDAAPTVVQEALYQSDTWSDRFVLPSNLGQPALMTRSFERLPGRAFALEFVKLFAANPEELAPAWVGRLGTLDRYRADGQLTELRQAWVSAGYAQDSDIVLVLEQRSSGEQVVIFGSVQNDATGARRGRIRGLLILPAQPKTCT